MKLQARVPFLKMMFTILCLQVFGILFVYFRENYLLNLSQAFVWIGLFMVAVMAYRQMGQHWGQGTEPQTRISALRVLKTFALFAFILFFFWQLNYLSLYLIQPLMYTPEHLPLRYDVVAGDLLGYSLRLGLQAWILALALALIFNKIPRSGEFGFIRGTYKKFSTLAWYLSNFCGGAVSIMMLVALSLLMLDTGKFIAKAFGADVMLVPQLDLIVFFFGLYVFNLATSFNKRLKIWGEEPKTSIFFVLSIQFMFVLFVYLLSYVMIYFLPQETVYALMEPFYFDFLDYQVFPRYWQLFMVALSIFMVPLLAHYLYHACQGERLLTSVVRNLLVPVGLCLILTQLFPVSQGVFFEWLPHLNMTAIELNDVTVRYQISFISYLSVGLFVMLLFMLQRSNRLTQSLIDIMPEHVGRRERRVKAFFSRTFTFFVILLMFYCLAGIVMSLYFSSIFLMATLLGLALTFIAGLKSQENTYGRAS